MSLKETLSQPFPYDPCTRDKVGMAAFFGAFIFLFLILFKPFELQEQPRSIWLISLAYGLITFCCVLGCNTLFPLLFPSTFNERAWTTGKQIVFTSSVIFLVGLANYLLSPMIVDTRYDLNTAVWFQGITLAVALIPVSIFILIRQNRLLRRFSKQAKEIEKKLQQKIADEQVVQTSPSQKITIVGDYSNEKIELYPDDLYFVASASNYIKLFHCMKDKVVYSIIRSTLKKTEERLLEYPNFFKCHRAYIINLDKVQHVEGNAQGYKVRIKGYEELIPVSRNLNAEFSDKLLAHYRPAANFAGGFN